MNSLGNRLKSKVLSALFLGTGLAGVIIPQSVQAFDTLYCGLTRVPDLDDYSGINKITGSTFESIPFALNDTEKPFAAQISQDPPVFVLYEKLPKKETSPMEYEVSVIRSASLKASDLTGPKKDDALKAARRKPDFAMSSATSIQDPDQNGNYADGAEGDKIAFSPRSVTVAGSSTQLLVISKDGRVLNSNCVICDQALCGRVNSPRNFIETVIERKRR
jgi:hypothetical protein